MKYEANIWKFYLFKIASSLEITISIFVLFFLVNGLSMTDVGILEMIYMIIAILLEIPSGAFADKYGRKLSVSLAMFLASLSFVVFGIGRDFYVFLVAQIIIAFASAFHSGAESALLYDSLKELKREDDYDKIYGRGNFYSLLTWSVSSLIGGFLVVYLGYRWLFFITSFLFFIAFIIGLWFEEPPIHIRPYIKNIKSAVKFSYEHKEVKKLIVYYGLFAALTYLAWFLIQPYYGDFPRYIVGIATFVYFISAGIGSLVAQWLRIDERRLLLGLLLIASLSFIGIFFVNKLFALFFICLMSLVSGIREIVVSKGINKHTDSHHRATVISMQNMSRGFMYAIFAPVIGYITDIFSASTTFLIMGISLFLFFIYYSVWSK